MWYWVYSIKPRKIENFSIKKLILGRKGAISKINKSIKTEIKSIGR